MSSAAVRRLALAAALLAPPSAAVAQWPDPPFDAAEVVADTTQRFEAVLDLDADGFADALSWYWTDDTAFDGARVSGWLNDGTGRLVQAWSFTLPVSGAQPFSLACTATGRLDADAREDFAVAFGADVHLWSSNGAVPPTELSVVVAPAPADSIVLGDFDGDGLDDLAAADGGHARLWLNGGAGRWTQSAELALPGALDEVLVGLDADGDGDDDLAVLDAQQVDLFLVQAGALAGTSSVSIGMAPAAANVLAAGDADADGDPDLVVFANDVGACALLRNQAGTFAPGTQQAGGPATHLFDVDGDGAADGVCCGGGPAPPKNTNPSQFEVALNDGTGDFAAAFTISSLGSAHIAGVADLDHDGDADLVGGRTIYRAQGPLAAAPHRALDSGDGLDVWGANASMVADADGDGDPDLRFGPPELQSNDGAGTLSLAPVTFPPVPGGKKWLGPGFPGDFDGDGDVDVVVSRWQGPFFGPTFLDNWLLRNAGGGLLWTATPATAAPANMSGAGVPIDLWDEPAASLAADADGDGDTDLFVRAGVWLGPTTLWLNDGNGLFTPGATWAEAVRTVARLDGDALPDLVFAGNGDVRVRFGAGGGAFGAPLALASAIGGKDDVAVLDVDGDGDLDLVAGPDGAPAPHAWLNGGGGAFSLDAALLAGFPLLTSTSLPTRFAVTDLDGDGRDDLLAGPAFTALTASWALVRKAGAPGFDSAGLVCVGVVSSADMDGDGDADVLGHDALLNDVLVPGLRFHGPSAGARLQHGASTAGSGGARPVLGASGPFRTGELVTLRLAGLPAGKLGLITVGLAASDLPGTPWLGSTAYNWPWAAFFFLVSPPGEPGAPGSSKLALSFTVTPDLPAVGPLHHQAWFADPGAPFGRVGTNGLMLEYE
ncbi:MAG: VCBS repeat-containing protein [Planctomycetes bacterium]|nr:VCBS repeat-containing protein [Planctomycetota bacterium]